MFFINTNQTFNETTKTLIITNSNEFTNDNKSSTVHVIISNVDEIKSNAFLNWLLLTTAHINSSVTKIGSSAFSGCNNLKTVILEEGLLTIGSFAFQNCYNLTNIYIPSSVTSIASNPFVRCKNLEYIKVSKGNSYYANYDNDGVLYDISISNLICYPSKL